MMSINEAFTVAVSAFCAGLCFGWIIAMAGIDAGKKEKQKIEK